MATKEIIFCGGLVCDSTYFTSRFPRPGETVPATKSIKGFGGCSANQCQMAKVMGAKTALVGKLGNDDFGKAFKVHLDENGINRDHVTVTPDAQTSIAIIMVNDEGENAIVHQLGAMDHFTVDDAAAAADDLLVQDGGQVLVCTYECSRKPLLEVLKRAKQKNVLTMLNTVPGPSEPWEEIYPYVDFAILNETEVELATSVEVNSVLDAESAARVLVAKGCGNVIVTLGKNGAIVVNGQDGSAIHASAPEVNVVDSTGAGDAFVGSLAVYLRYYPELSMLEKLSRACAVAAITVQSEGTQASYPSVVPEHLLRHSLKPESL